MSKPSEYETIMIEKHLKDSIITQAQASYSTQHSLHRVWNVILEGNEDGEVRAHVIVYKDSSGLTGYDDLAHGCATAYEKDALEDLLEKLQFKFAVEENDDNSSEVK